MASDLFLKRYFFWTQVFTGLGQGGRHAMASAQIRGPARENAPLNTTSCYRDFKPRATCTAVPYPLAGSAIQAMSCRDACTLHCIWVDVGKYGSVPAVVAARSIPKTP